MKPINYNTVPDSSGGIAIIKVADFLYTAGDNTLCVYDISIPDQPKLLRRLHGFGHGRQFAAANNKLYLTARNYGLWILSIDNPARPKVLTRFDTVELATGIAVASDFVFVTHRIYGIEILDCVNPYQPKHCAMIKTGEAQSAVFHSGRLYVGDWATGHLTVIDVSNPYQPHILSKSDLGGYGDGLAIAGDLCCVTTGLNRKGETTSLGGAGHGLDLFRIAPDQPPQHLSRLEFPRLLVKTNDFWTVRISGKTAFVADTHNGMFQVDLSDPQNPVCTGRIVLPDINRLDAREGEMVQVTVPDCVGSVAIGKGILYIIGQKTGLHLAAIPEADKTQIDIPTSYKFTPQKSKSVDIPGFRSYNLDGQVRRVTVDEKNSRAFVACSHAGIKLVDLTNSVATIVSTHKIDCSYDVIFRDGKLYSAEGLAGLAIYAVAGTSLRELGRFKGRGRFFQLLRLSGNGRFIVCSSRDGVLRILDITNPAAIRVVRRHLHGGLLYGDTMPESDYNNIMPVLWPYAGIAWYDLSGVKPKIVYDDCKNRPAGQCEGITWWNGYFLMSTLENKIRLLNPSDYGKTWREIPNNCTGVPAANGDIVAFSHRRNGYVRVYRMSEQSAQFLPERSLEGLTGTPDRVVFYCGRMIIPCGYQGMLIEN